jgi:hypothetical protein
MSRHTIAPRAPRPAVRSGAGPWRSTLLLLLVGLSAAAVAGCGRGLDPDRGRIPSGNLPPTTSIVNPTLSGDETTYNLLVSWKGYDEDGTVAGFEVAVDETSSWRFTTSFDSLFVFRAEQCCVTDTIESEDGSTRLDSLAFRFHRLFVRALDNEGAEDRSPEALAFTATNVFPTTVLLRGPSPTGSGQITAPTVIFEWEGRDSDGVVAGYRYRLDDRPWIAVGADCTRVRFTNLSTAEFVDDPRGKHAFAVLSIDDAGADERFIEEPRNRRRWESVADIRGTLEILSNVMGSRSGLSQDEGQIFEGTAVSFTWRGDASLYGGIVLCYQYAYDQRQVFSGCDLGSTRFPVDRHDFVPTIGSHALFVNAFDDAGQKIEGGFPFVVLPVTSDHRLLFVDDFDNGGSGGTEVYPGDPVEDAFWDSVFAGYARTAFDAAAMRDIPSIRLVAEASTLIWYVDDEDTWLDTSSRPEQYRNPMRSYVNAGGNLIVCGSLVTDPLTPDNYFVPEDQIGGQCLHRPQHTYRGGERELNWFPAPCDEDVHLVYDVFQVSQSINEIAQQTLLESLRSLRPDIVPDLALDLDKRGDDPGGVPLLSRGLEACEQYVLPGFPIGDPEAAIPLWTFVDVLGRERRVCGLLVPASARTGRGNVVLLGFPPYYFKTDEMQSVFRALLDRFGEPRLD